jgi:5-aminolevulinate synthase
MKDLFRQRRIPIVSMETHIVPVLVGDPHKCTLLADGLLHEHAQYVQPINFPSVSRGTERLRITPSPLHTPSAVRRFVDHIDQAWSEFELPRAPDFVPPRTPDYTVGSRPPFAAGAVGHAVSG